MMLMKNERCLIKKIIEISKKIVKISMFLIGFTILSGFYSERNIYIDLEEITVELGDTLEIESLDYINSYLSNSNLFLEDNVPKDEDGETTKIGTYNYYIVYRDEGRKYSRFTNKRSTITVVDTIKPEIKLKETSLKFEFGSEIKASDIATCVDLSTCSMSFKEDVNTRKAGNVEVVIEAIDEGGNINEKTVNITIKEKPKPVYYSYNTYSYGFLSKSIVEMNNHNNNINSGLSEEEKMSLRYALVEFAKQFNGNPYVYGGNSLTNGIDCSGFTMAIYNNFGYQLPRIAGSQGHMGIKVSADKLLPGDIIMYITNGIGSHVGIYIGNGLMIHAANPRDGIVIIPMYDGYRTYHRIIY